MKLKDFIIIALALIIIYLSTCNKPQVKVETKTVTRTDSLYFHDTIVKTVKMPVKEAVYIYSKPLDSFRIDLSDTNVFYSTYVYEHKDSLIYGFISVENDKRPSKVSFEYEFKQFTLKDSVYVRDSVYQEAKKSFMSAGMTLIGSKNSFGFAPVLQYNHKKGNTYNVGYDLINGNFHVGFTKKLSFRKK